MDHVGLGRHEGSRFIRIDHRISKNERPSREDATQNAFERVLPDDTDKRHDGANVKGSMFSLTRSPCSSEKRSPSPT